MIDCREALRLGYVPKTTFADAVGTTCDWLVSDAANGTWMERYPVLAAYPRDLFDYAAEDAFLRTKQ